MLVLEGSYRPCVIGVLLKDPKLTMRTEIQQQVRCLCASLKTQALSSGAVLLIFFVSRNRPAAMLHNSLHPSNGTETNHQDIQVSSHSKFKESCTSSENSQQSTAASATASAANASSAAYSPILQALPLLAQCKLRKSAKKSKKRILRRSWKQFAMRCLHNKFRARNSLKRSSINGSKQGGCLRMLRIRLQAIAMMMA